MKQKNHSQRTPLKLLQDTLSCRMLLITTSRMLKQKMSQKKLNLRRVFQKPAPDQLHSSHGKMSNGTSDQKAVMVIPTKKLLYVLEGYGGSLAVDLTGCVETYAKTVTGLWWC